MAQYFDTAAWRQLITQRDWYLQLYPELATLRKQWEAKPETAETEALKQAVRGFFEVALADGSLALGKSGPNLDAERRPIDTIVIHHTSSEPGYRLSYMNAVQLLNVYVPYFYNPADPKEKNLQGKPLWSNHVRSGRPVFYLYHWLMRMDGRFDRLLMDNELGWHAANWEINCRSVAICLDNDYEENNPSPEALKQLADFISRTYPQVTPARVFGHREVSQKSSTTCPGNTFVGGWKDDLVRLLRRTR